MPVEAVKLERKIIKDASFVVNECSVGSITLHDFSIGGQNLYLEVMLDHSLDHFSDSHPHDFVSVHFQLLGSEAFHYFNLDPKPAPSGASGQVRKALCLVMGQQMAPGEYRIKLIVDGQEIVAVSKTLFVDGANLYSNLGRDREPRQFLLSGTEKSGTTWLGAIVDSLPEALVLQEGNSLNYIETDKFSRQLEIDYSEFAARHFIAWRPSFPNTREYTHFAQIGVARALIAELGNLWGGNIVADRTPHYSDRYMSCLRHWPELKIVHIVRHPLDVLVSWFFHEINVYIGSGHDRKLVSEDMSPSFFRKFDQYLGKLNGPVCSDAELFEGVFDSFLNKWIADQQHALRAAESFSGRILILKYEDIAAEFTSAASDLFHFMGVNQNDDVIRRAYELSNFKSMSGGRTAGDKDNTSFFRNGRVGDFRNHLTGCQVSYCWERVRGVAERFGYELDLKFCESEQ